MTLDGPRWGPRGNRKAGALVVLCHGVGADGQDLIELAPAWADAAPEAAFVAPNAPFPYAGAPYGRQWFGIADRTPAILEAGVRTASPMLAEFVTAELARLSLPMDAFVLMGFSQGAMISLFTGLRAPPPPRAILAFSGALLAPGSLAAELTHRPPVLLVHGEDDDVVPVSRSRDAARTLAASGVPVEALYCPRLGHGIDQAGISAGALFLQRAFST